MRSDLISDKQTTVPNKQRTRPVLLYKRLQTSESKMAAENYILNLSMNRIHDVVQKSGLHFVINQTPFSSYITIRRKFTFAEGNQQQTNNFENVIETQTSKVKVENLKSDLKDLEIKNKHLKEALVQSEEESKIAIIETEKRLDNIHVFANKLKAESELLRCEKSVLDKVINNHHMEVTKQKNEISQLSRTLKIKEKEIYNLRNKELNQQDSIKNLKVSLKEMKAEKTQIEKETTKLKKKHLRKHDLNDTNENVKTVDRETETHMFVAQPACVDLQAFTKLPALTDMSSSTPSSTTCSYLIPNFASMAFSPCNNLSSSSTKASMSCTSTSLSPTTAILASSTTKKSLTTTTASSQIMSPQSSVVATPTRATLSLASSSSSASEASISKSSSNSSVASDPHFLKLVSEQPEKTSQGLDKLCDETNIICSIRNRL